MEQRRRIYYSAAQRSEIWDRWQAGEPISSIGRRFDRESSSVFSVISPTGGIRPPVRRRGRETLSLFEREEISRGLSTQCSLRSIARQSTPSSTTMRPTSIRGCANGWPGAETNADPKPFVWIADPKRVLAAVKRSTSDLILLGAIYLTAAALWPLLIATFT